MNLWINGRLGAPALCLLAVLAATHVQAIVSEVLW